MLTLALLPGLLALPMAASSQALEACARCTGIPMVTPYPGSVLVGSQHAAFDEIRLAAGPRRPDGTEHRITPVLDLEGRLDRAFYQGPQGRSGLEVYRNYEQAFLAAGFATVFACSERDDGCGKDLSYGIQYELKQALPEGNILATQGIPDAINQRYALLRRDAPDKTIHVALLVADLQFRDRPAAVISVVESAAMQGGQVTVNVDALRNALAAEGRIALYGIAFDFDSAVIQSSSRPQLEAIAALLKADPALKLRVAGHTDNQGADDYNLHLSRARADEVVEALVSGHGIEASRLTASGLGAGAPVAPNDSEEGRAKNRRVELVRQ